MGGLPAEMSGGFIVSSQSVGVQSGGKAVTPTHEHADSGIDPVSVASRVAGVERSETRDGVAALAVVGGKDHAESAALGAMLKGMGAGSLAEKSDIQAATTGMATGLNGPDVNGRA